MDHGEINEYFLEGPTDNVWDRSIHHIYLLGFGCRCVMGFK